MRVWPEGPMFGLTRRRIRIVARIVLTLSAGVLVLYGSAWIFLRLEANRAKGLMRELEAISLGQSEGSLKPILKEFEDKNSFEGIRATGNNRVVLVDPWRFRRPFSRVEWVDHLVRGCIGEYGFASQWRRRLGLRFWEIYGSVEVAKEKVQRVSVVSFVEGENEWLGAKWIYEERPERPDRHTPPGGAAYPAEMRRYRSGWTHLHMGGETGEVLWNEINAEATPEEQIAGKELNLDCLTSWRGCHSLCELMPEAAVYRHAHGYGPLGWNSGSWGSQDHACE